MLGHSIKREYLLKQAGEKVMECFEKERGGGSYCQEKRQYISRWSVFR